MASPGARAPVKRFSSGISEYTVATLRSQTRLSVLLLLMAGSLWLLAPSVLVAQGRSGRGRGGRGGPPPTAKASAPIDLTGYWTAVITEDWHPCPAPK